MCNSLSLQYVSTAMQTCMWDNNALNELNKIVDYVIQGLAILKRFSSQEQRGLLKGGRLLVSAAIISRGSDSSVQASRRRTECPEKNAREIIPALTAWAKSIGCWTEYSQRDASLYYLTHGGEAEVYFAGEGKIKKLIGLDYFIDPQLALDRIVIHNCLFPETFLYVTGFGTNSRGEFAIIVEQTIIQGEFTPQEEIDVFLARLGLEKCSDSAHTYANQNLYLSDLHEENVLNVDHNRFYAIDGDFRLNTPSARIGGIREIDDSICFR